MQNKSDLSSYFVNCKSMGNREKFISTECFYREMSEIEEAITISSVRDEDFIAPFTPVF